MIEKKGNLWESGADAICITTNGFIKKDGTCVMGRGCAKEAADKWPFLPKMIGWYLKHYGNKPIVLSKWTEDAIPFPFYLVTLPVKHNWWEDADPYLIAASLGALDVLCIEHNWQSVALPRPGCGNGKLSWEDIEPICSMCLTSDIYTVYSYE